MLCLLHDQLSFFWGVKSHLHMLTVCMLLCCADVFCAMTQDTYCTVSGLMKDQTGKLFLVFWFLFLWTFFLVFTSWLKLAFENMQRSNDVPCMCDTVTVVSCGQNVLTATCLSFYHLITPWWGTYLDIYKMDFGHIVTPWLWRGNKKWYM